MSSEDHKALVLEAFDTLFNRRDYAAAERFWSPDYIQHSAHIAPGRAGLFELIRAMPDTLRYEHGLILAEGDHVMVHGRFSGNDRAAAWIAVDILRIENGRLAEHWDVLQDEATKADSISKLPMFGGSFPKPSSGPRAHRRVVTGHRDGKAVILGDERRSAYGFETVNGFEHVYMWAAQDAGEAHPDDVERELSRSALPAPGGSHVQIVTFPPATGAPSASEADAIAREYRARLPGLADSFERDRSQMHATPTLDYAFILDGELWLELDDGETVRLTAGDLVVQQATRHGWRNKGRRPATIAFVMLGA